MEWGINKHEICALPKLLPDVPIAVKKYVFEAGVIAGIAVIDIFHNSV